ncbi:hypothetical protein ACI2LC_14580 [Nonomuraea wenchangensis]|uniref:DUF7701 domain-containing protein n=1 Tax=Nonomuraea wenchangensis TaxID=568860 RepID=UPI00384BCC48
MTYLDDDAALVRRMLADTAQPPSDAELLFLLYGVLLRVKGDKVSASDVHDAWTVWMQVRNPNHPALLPYDELDLETRMQDLPYMQAIRQAARIRQAQSGER